MIKNIQVSGLEPHEAYPPGMIDVQRFRPGWYEAIKHSIEQHGILVPIVYWVDGAGKRIVIDGWGRVAVAQALGLTWIPAVESPRDCYVDALIYDALQGRDPLGSETDDD